MRTTKEEWKDIPGYENYYQASNHGRIKRVGGYIRHSNNSMKNWSEKVLAQKQDAGGYLKVEFSKDGKRKNILCHRAVCAAFHENPQNLPQVNHKDGDKTNNSVDNLEWCSKSHNRLHAFATGLTSAKGSKNSQAILTVDRVLKIRESNERVKDLARQHGVSPATICDIKNRRSWAHIPA